MTNSDTISSLKEASFQRFFRSIPDLMIIVDGDGQIQSVNPAVEKSTGWSLDQLVGQNLRDYLPTRDDILLRYGLEQAKQQQQTTLKIELPFICRDQKLRWVNWSFAIDSEEGQVYGVGRDLSNQSQGTIALFQSETWFRAVLNHAPLIVYALDRDGSFIFSEGRGLDRLGLQPGEVVGQSVFERYRAFPETIAALRDALNGKPRHWVAQVQDSFYDCRVALVENDVGEIQGLIGVSTDITDLVEAQTTLENLFLGTASVTGQDFFNALVQYLAMALGVQYAMINDLKGDRFHTLAFWANGEIQPNINYDVSSAPGCSKVLASQKCLYVPQMGEERNCPLLKPLQVNTYLGAPLKNPQGEAVGTLCILNDRPLPNTEQAQRILKIFAARAGAELNRLKVEQALEHLNEELEVRVQEQTQRWEQSQLQFKRLVQNVPGAVYTVQLSADGMLKMLYISNRITDLLGLKPKEIKKNYQEVIKRIHPEDQATFDHSIQWALQTRKRWIWDGRFLHEDGTYRWLRWNAQLADTLETSSKQVFIWDGVLIDISDRKAAEISMQVALEKQQEMNEIKSRMITTMSHEFRTPLAIISSSASILKNFADQLPNDKRKQHLETIETYIQHTSQLLEDVLALNRVNAGKLSFQPRRVNLVHLLSGLVNDLYLSYEEHPLSFHTTLIDQSQGEEADVDSKLLRQIVLNLIGNGVKYSVNKTPVRIKLTLTIDKIILTIRDAGIGVLPEDQKHLFEPFHRGQNVGQRSGTGLGLSVVKGCVDLHQGQIKMKSQPGKGTIFQVTLPRYTDISEG